MRAGLGTTRDGQHVHYPPLQQARAIHKSCASERVTCPGPTKGTGISQSKGFSVSRGELKNPRRGVESSEALDGTLEAFEDIGCCERAGRRGRRAERRLSAAKFNLRSEDAHQMAAIRGVGAVLAVPCMALRIVPLL